MHDIVKCTKKVLRLNVEEDDLLDDMRFLFVKKPYMCISYSLCTPSQVLERMC